MKTRRGRRGVPMARVSLNHTFNPCNGCVLKSKATIRDAKTGKVERVISCETNCRRKRQTHHTVTNFPIQAMTAEIIHKAMVKKLEEKGGKNE